MSLQEEIKTILETSFDIPFEVRVLHPDTDLQVMVTPKDSNKKLFDIRCVSSNKIRLVMFFLPQDFAVPMVKSMGTAELEKKVAFCSYAQQLIDAHAKLTLEINGSPHSPINYANWPASWEKVAIVANIIPIVMKPNDEPDYKATLSKWLPSFTGLSLSLLNVVKNISELEESPAGYSEGTKHTATSVRYERNPLNRLLCLNKYGYTCQICGFNFEKKYGELGQGFIHVHHITPVSQLGENYVINPLSDLIPVCPNCHAMLHRGTKVMHPNTLRELIRKQE